MHPFTPRWPDDDDGYVPPDPFDIPFRSATDLVDWAETEPLTLWNTFPEVLHLGDDGLFRCHSRGSLIDGVRLFAQQPSRMLRARATSTGAPCGDYWVMMEPRHPWDRRGAVDERDAACFLKLRRSLARQGVWLLDVVVFDQSPRWWSLHELTSGTTAWEFPARPRARLRRPTPRRCE